LTGQAAWQGIIPIQNSISGIRVLYLGTLISVVDVSIYRTSSKSRSNGSFQEIADANLEPLKDEGSDLGHGLEPVKKP
jgi:hypothetical protein